MFSIIQNHIVLTAGDTGRITIDIRNPDGSIYTPNENDIITLMVKTCHDDMDCCIHKQGIDIVFEPEDTINLPHGKYIYGVKILLANGDVNTIIESGIFEIRKGVS